MGSKQEAFVNNAKKYIGQGPAKFRKWYCGHDEKGTPWCAIFVSYVAKETGILNTLIPKHNGAGSIAREGVKAGCGTWYEGHNTKPQVGDLIFLFGMGKADVLAKIYIIATTWELYIKSAPSMLILLRETQVKMMLRLMMIRLKLLLNDVSYIQE